MKKIIIEGLLVQCIAYTILSVIISLLALIPELMMEITALSNLSLFICPTVISIAMVWTSHLNIASEWLEKGLMFIEVNLIVYVLGGGVFHWFPWSIYYVLEVFVIILVVFICVWLIMYELHAELARNINQKIKENRYEKHHHC